MSPEAVRVRCSGAMHAISVTAGRLRLENHSLKAERSFVALGGEKCRCVQILDAWREQDRKVLSPALCLELTAAHTAAASKKKNHQTARDPLLSPLAVRLATRVTAAAKKSLIACGYRRSQSGWAGGEHYAGSYISPHPTISGWSDRVWSDNGKWSGSNSHVSAGVPLGWYSRVYNRGLAIIDGCFILDVFPGEVVLAGKQGRGFEVYPAPAKISSTGKLQWIKEGK